MSYFYWLFVLVITGGTLYLLGYKLQQWIPALVISAVLAVACVGFYYFYLEQMLVKRWGGSMSITIPAGLQHISATWKGDNLWIQNYDPETNTCVFQEYSRGNMLQGEVRLKNCNPLIRTEKSAR